MRIQRSALRMHDIFSLIPVPASVMIKALTKDSNLLYFDDLIFLFFF